MNSKLRSITTSLKRHAPRKVATTLTLGALATALAISAGAPAFAGKPHQSRHGGHHEQTQEHDVRSAKKGNGNTNKKKSVKKTFASDGAIAIPAVDLFGPAEPFPSSIDVAGFKKAKITDVNLSLRGFSHTFPGDVQLLLVAPGGSNAVVMGDVGGNDEVDESVTNLTFTLDDEAVNLLPEDEVLTSGSFRPLDGQGPGFSGDLTEFPAPAPEPSGNNALSTFDGINPNGEWQLFIVDDDNFDSGDLAKGWTLEITAKSKVKNTGNGKKKR